MLRAFQGIQPCQIGRSKYQHKRNPRPQQAGEHIQAFVDQERHDEEIYDDHKAHKYGRGPQRRSVIELLEVDQRNDHKENRGSDRMDDQRIIDRRGRHADAHGCSAKRPTHKGMS